MRSLNLVSPAKVNLYLKVLSKRRDGFHNIVSIMEKISLCDSLYIALTRKRGIDFRCNWHYLENENNLVVRAIKLVQREIGGISSQGIKVILHKRIPVGSGLGGASSNAASVILGLNQLLHLRLTQTQMFTLGATLGSDVNFFISPAKFALVEGRGEKIFPLNTPLRLQHYLILLGSEAISTAKIYNNFSQKPRLTNFFDNAKLMTFAIEKEDSSLLKRLLFNNLTPMALEASARLRKVYRLISKLKGEFVLSGSGSGIVYFPAGRAKSVREKISKIRGLELRKVTTF
jgi:4-diphosphocytidyl-2-C-methyl-D-erythritol kinase